MLIDKKITRKIANLARIELTDKEIDEYSKDLTNILSWINQLKKVEVFDEYSLCDYTLYCLPKN